MKYCSLSIAVLCTFLAIIGLSENVIYSLIGAMAVLNFGVFLD